MGLSRASNCLIEWVLKHIACHFYQWGQPHIQQKGSQGGSAILGSTPESLKPKTSQNSLKSHQLLLGLIHHFPKEKNLWGNPRELHRSAKKMLPLRDTGVGCPSSCTGRKKEFFHGNPPKHDPHLIWYPHIRPMIYHHFDIV